MTSTEGLRERKWRLTETLRKDCSWGGPPGVEGISEELPESSSAMQSGNRSEKSIIDWSLSLLDAMLANRRNRGLDSSRDL